VSTFKGNSVLISLDLLEADGGMTILALGSIVVETGRLVAVCTQASGLCRKCVAGHAIYLSMCPGEIEHMGSGQYRGPLFRGLMAGSAHQGCRLGVRGDVACITIGERAVQLTGDVAVQADTHRADDLSAHRVEPMSRGAMAVTAGNVDQFSMGDCIVGCTQPVLWELGWKVRVAGDA
jgi:hypothetical protein